MTEKWRDIEGCEDSYQVSDQGRVRSLTREITSSRNGKKFTKILKGRVLKQAVSFGYPYVNLRRDGKQWVIRTRRLVAQAFIGECPDGCEVNHKDGDKSNNHVENLEYTTHAENVRHASENGLHGALSKEQVQAIRYIILRNRKFPLELIASKFNTSIRVIKGVVYARTHVHVPNIDGTPVVPLSRSMCTDGILLLRDVGFEAREISMALDVEYSAPFQALNRSGIRFSNTQHTKEDE